MRHEDRPCDWTPGQWSDYLDKMKALIIKKNAHWDAFYFCDRRDRCINLPIVVLSSFMSTSAVSQVGLDDGEANEYALWFIALLSVLITALTTCSKFYNYAERKEAHRLTSLNYYRARCELITTVEEGGEEEKEGENGDDNAIRTKKGPYSQFLRDYYVKTGGIRENAPTLPEKIFKKLKKDRKTFKKDRQKALEKRDDDDDEEKEGCAEEGV
jgi:hypothetical protein